MARLPAVTSKTELAIGRIRKAQIAQLEPRDLVLTLVPEVETRVDEMISDLVNETEFAETPVGAFLIRDNLDTYFKTWVERRRILKEILNFHMSGQKTGQQFQLLLEIRNALMHGNGALTRQQSTSFQKVLQLEKSLLKEFSIETQGQLLILENMDRTRVGEAALAYLIAVDQKFMNARRSEN